MTNRWSSDPLVVKAKHDAEDEHSVAEQNRLLREPITLEQYKATRHRSENSDLWLWSWGPPRVCSFCGGLHPEDAFRLLADGWENHFAKPTKGYLEPPGTRTARDALMASFHKPSIIVPSVWSPVPPVKIYVMHFTDEQIDKLNEIGR